MIESRNCPECGAEIIFIYQTPERAYRIKDGELIRDDNNTSDDPELNPYCSNDREHQIDMDIPDRRPEDFWTWSDGVYINFIDRGLYEV
jgi:hypothetical protein